MGYSYDELYLIGIGSSAGGIEALKSLLPSLPIDIPASYIIVQHLNPNYKSMLSEILSRESKMDVLEIQNGLEIEAQKIYVAPPNVNVLVKEGKFETQESKQLIGPRPSVDLLFISLANEKASKAIGVILSGTGSDGTVGLRAIKSAGGVTLAHDPKSAKYNGMPLSAIEDGVVDKILRPEDMGPFLKTVISKEIDPEEAREIPVEPMNDIFSILREAFDVDFSMYKSATIYRRIEKRINALKLNSISEYYRYLAQNEEEKETLYRTLLIGVTSFYRDYEAFEALSNVLRGYIERHQYSDFRAWSVGCATGEEAYTIAIILSNLAEQMGRSLDIQVFATDIDENSLSQARGGIYSEIISTALPKLFLDKYFRKKGNMYEVVRSIREKVIFSKHNILKDPPFLRLDLVCCRNLLIYLKSDIQQKVLLSFHHSLRGGGILFLGKSESLGGASAYFSTISTKYKIFASRQDIKPQAHDLIIPRQKNRQKEGARDKKGINIEEIISSVLYNEFVQKCVVIDENTNLLFIKGSLDGIVSLPKGTVNLAFNKMICDELSVDFRSLLFKASKSGEPQRGRPKTVKIAGERRKIAISIFPLRAYISGYLVVFDEFAADEEQSSQTDEGLVLSARYKELEEELNVTREHLQTVIEELETSNEELQAANEELQSSNEELQATNEELETSNEELQSSNEELQTAYIELKMAYEEQARQRESLAEANRELVKLNEELSSKERFINALLDAEQAIVIVTRRGEEILDANGAFFRFFDEYASLDEFKAFHKSICEMFEPVEGDEEFLPPGYSKRDGKSWLELVMSNTQKRYKALIKKNGKGYVFSVRASDLDVANEKYVVILNNITDIEEERAVRKLLEAKSAEEVRKKERAKLQRAILSGVSEYINAVSLSWRSPIASVANILSELVEDFSYMTPTVEAIKEFEDRCLTNLKEVLNSIEQTKEFFTISKNREYFDISSMIDGVIKTLKSGIGGEKVLIRYDGGGKRIDFYGFADETRLMLYDILLIYKNYYSDKDRVEIAVNTEIREGFFIIRFASKQDVIGFGQYITEILGASDDSFESDTLIQIDSMRIAMVKSIVESEFEGSLVFSTKDETGILEVTLKIKT